MCRPAVVLHVRLIALAQPARSFARALVATPFQPVPLLLRPENKILRTCGSDLESKKLWRRVSSIRFFPTCRRSVSLLLRRRINPPTGAVRLCRSLACGSACLRARTSRLSIAALPLLPKKDARIVGVRA